MEEPSTKTLFVLSLDFELAWGTQGNESYRRYYEGTRSAVQALLTLFERYRISATWATVGHLFLRSCNPSGNVHPEIARPDDDDWFLKDPRSDVNRDPLWYAPDVIEMIQHCSTPQDIGCHTFSHLPVSDTRCTEERFSAELSASRDAAKLHEIELSSFVYPKNHIAYEKVLTRYGFKSFRGIDRSWYSKLPSFLHKIGHVIDNYARVSIPVVTPKKHDGLWEIPGSYFYPHRHGWARHLPVSFRVQKVKAGLKKAVRDGGIVHLWFHPFNIVSDEDGLIGGLDSILKTVADYREDGLLNTLSMKDCADYLENNSIV